MRFSCFFSFPVAALPTAAALLAFALSAPAAHAQVTESLIGLNNNNQLFRFSASTTGGPSTAAIATTNLAGGAGLTNISGVIGTIQSIDFRPSNGLLYGLSSSSVANPTLRLYTIDTTTGNATLLSTLVASTGGTNATATAFVNSNYSIEFNPVADALRIVNDMTGNYRISAANLANGSGTAFTDMALSQSGIVGAAYTNNFAGATSTRLFDTQLGTSTLFEQTPPNAGTLVAQPGATGLGNLFGDVDVSGITGFGYFAGNFNASNELYRFNDINTSASTTQVGTFSNSLARVVGIATPVGPAAAAPEPGTLPLIGMGLVSGIGSLGIARKRRKNAA